MKKKIIIIFSIILIIIMIVLITTNKKEKQKINLSEIKYTNNSFNLNLIKTVNISNNNENYLISPYSIEIALSMLRDGAKDKTYDEINSVIGNREINDVTIKNRVNVANAIFVKNKYKEYLKNEYYNILKNKYNSDILYDDFKTPKVINAWVDKKTDGMIKDILNDIDDNFTLGLANALAIDVEWNSPFDCSATTKGGFTKEDNKIMQVEMMHQTLKYGSYKYLKNNNATGVIIPYKKYDKNTGEESYNNENNLEFIAILPNNSLYNYINDLTEEELNNLFNTAREVSEDFEIELSLPRFKYNYELSNFEDILKSLGIKAAFDEDNANFTNIMPRNDELGNLYVGESIHKTHIDLNEKGTKAAAITFFGMFNTSSMPKQKEKAKIIFNKPFMYMIRDNKTNEMLFFGTVYEPNKWNGSTCSDKN